MRRFSILASIAISILWTSGQPASAANVKDVLSACDRTAGCSYSQAKNGDISGCSSKTCFYCPADGKRQCFSAARGGGKGSVTDIGGVKLQPGTVPANAAGKAIKTAPKAIKSAPVPANSTKR